MEIDENVLSECDRVLLENNLKTNFYTAKRLLRNFLQNDVKKLFSIIFKRMNEKCTTDQDNGMAERHKEHYHRFITVQQSVYCQEAELFRAKHVLTKCRRLSCAFVS